MALKRQKDKKQNKNKKQTPALLPPCYKCKLRKLFNPSGPHFPQSMVINYFLPVLHREQLRRGCRCNKLTAPGADARTFGSQNQLRAQAWLIHLQPRVSLILLRDPLCSPARFSWVMATHVCVPLVGELVPNRKPKPKLVNLGYYARQKHPQKGRRNTFSDALKWREFIPSRPTL